MVLRIRFSDTVKEFAGRVHNAAKAVKDRTQVALTDREPGRVLSRRENAEIIANMMANQKVRREAEHSNRHNPYAKGATRKKNGVRKSTHRYQPITLQN